MPVYRLFCFSTILANACGAHIILYRRRVLDLGAPPPIGPLSPGKFGLNWWWLGLLELSLQDKPVIPLANAAREAPPKSVCAGGGVMSLSIELRRRRFIRGRRLTNGSVEFRRDMVTGFDLKYVLLSLFLANCRKASSIISSDTPLSAQYVVIPVNTNVKKITYTFGAQGPVAQNFNSQLN